jgi:serine/threonine protein kinase
MEIEIENENVNVINEKEQIENKNNYKTIAILDNKFNLIKKLGKGSTSSVYLGYIINDPEQKLYSFKIMKSQVPTNIIEKEAKILSSLNGENTIKIYSYGKGNLINLKSKKEKEIYYLMLEYLQNGELLMYVYLTKGFGEIYGRLIFLNLLEALEEIHNANIVHRDIKIENIMVSDDYKLKLVDFGFATQKNGLLSSYLGTPSYAAPELFLSNPYIGEYIDIFSLGVTLFVIVTGTFPFKTAFINDDSYQYFYKNDYLNFWLKKKNLNLSISFMELFDSLCAFEPSQRPSISEIKNSKWMKEINLNYMPKLKDELKLLSVYIKEKKEKEL